MTARGADSVLSMVLAKHVSARQQVGLDGVDAGTQRWIARNVAFAGMTTRRRERWHWHGARVGWAC